MRRSIPTISSLLLAAATVAVPLSLTAGKANGAPARAHRARRTVRATRGGQVALHPVELPDGSGTMQLPAGWRITYASKGMVDASGPQGSVSLGTYCEVFTPQGAAQMYVRPQLAVPYGDPALATRQLTAAMNASPGRAGSDRWIRLIEKSPIPWAGGVGAVLHYEWLFNGVRCQSVAMVVEAPTVNGTFMYYSSTVTAPSAMFARSLPVLLQVWAHWKVADHVLLARLTHAVETMKETGRIIRETNDRRQEAMDRANRAADLNIRGHWMIEDTETGKPIDEVGYEHIDKTLEARNHAAGYERYKMVPYHKLPR